MLELVAPAHSQEAVAAAVQNGADAVYIALGGTRLGLAAGGFTEAQFETAARYCRLRGAKIYAALDTLVSDEELAEAAQLARRAAEFGADAIVVQDIGLLRTLRRIIPGMPFIAGSRFGADNLAGVEAAMEMGAARVTLARELGFEQLSYIAERSPIELSVTLHGDSCVCKAGSCYLSSLTVGRSANRGDCSRPCQARYYLGSHRDDYPLSLRDNCLLEHIEELRSINIAAVTIDHGAESPEHIAALTGIYSRAIREGKSANSSELNLLERFSPNGLTDGYFTGRRGGDMFSPPTTPEPIESAAMSRLRQTYAQSETRRVRVRLFAAARHGEPFALGAEDPEGRRAFVLGSVPVPATGNALTRAALAEILYRTGGTPYVIENLDCVLEPGQFVPYEELDALLKLLLTKLSDARMSLPDYDFHTIPPLPGDSGHTTPPVLTIEVQSARQLSERLSDSGAALLYIPIEEYIENFDSVFPFIAKGIEVAVTIPRSITGAESGQLRAPLEKARELGARQALIRSTGHIRIARLAGFELRGDYSINVYNSYTLATLKEAGLLSATLSFELPMNSVRDMRKSMDTELIIFGRLPLMLTEHCIIEHSSGRHSCRTVNAMRDGSGNSFPLMREFGCRNVVFSSDKLYLADRRADYSDIGLWATRLCFTTESARECADITNSYISGLDFRPNSWIKLV